MGEIRWTKRERENKYKFIFYPIYWGGKNIFLNSFSLPYDGASVKAEKKFHFYSAVFENGKTVEFFFSAVLGKTVEIFFRCFWKNGGEFIFFCVHTCTIVLPFIRKRK